MKACQERMQGEEPRVNKTDRIKEINRRGDCEKLFLNSHSCLGEIMLKN